MNAPTDINATPLLEDFPYRLTDNVRFADLDLEYLKSQAEEQQTVRDSVAQLPQRCRQLIELLYFDTRSPSYEEVSRILEIPTASIGPTRGRCLEKLRTLLRRRGIK